MKYKIKAGDTLSQIAKDNNISIKELAEFNNIKDINKIYAGRTLNIPSRKKNTPTRTQPVKKVKETTKPIVTEEESFLPINIRQIFNPEQDRTEKDLSKEERDTLKEVIARSQTPERIAEKKAAGLSPFAIEYKDYETTKKDAQYADVGGSMGLLGLFNKLQNPAYNLKTFLGQASAIPQEGGGYRIQDVYDFQPKTQKQGLSKFGEYLSSVGRAGFNPYRQVRNFMGYYGPQEGTGEGGRSDIRIMQQGGDTMDIKQQTKNVAAQGRYGDSMLLHVNPAEVKGLASAMPITVNPQTGQPEAFLPFLAPIFGSMLGGSLLAGSTLGGLASAGLSKAAAAGIGAGLAQTAVTGDIKEGLKAGLTAGMGARIFGGGAEAQKFAEGAQKATDAATQINTDVLLQDPSFVQPGELVAGQMGPPPPVLNPAGQMELANMMPDASNYIAQGGKDAVAAYSGNVPGTGAATFGEDFSTVFSDGVGQGLSNIGTAAMNDPLALATLGTTGTMYGMDMMQADYEEQMRRMEAERRERKRQNELMNPEPILYTAAGGLTQFDEGGFIDNLLSGDIGMLGLVSDNPELMFGAAGIAAKNNFRGSLLGELYNQYKKKKDSGDDVGAAALQSEIQNQQAMTEGGLKPLFAPVISSKIQNQETMEMAQGGTIRGFNGQAGSTTDDVKGGELPQVFAPARQAYDVNPNFMPGFNPETMYFNPATIAAPASSLTGNTAPPVVEDTYTGTKGGYGGDPLVISPEGQQASIDPFTAYTGPAPAGLVPYSTTLPKALDITGTDLGLPMGEGTPVPAGVEMDDEIITFDEPSGNDIFIDPIDIGGMVNIPNIGNINIPGLSYFDQPAMGGQSFGIPQLSDNQLLGLFDLVPEPQIPVVTRKEGGKTLKPIPEDNKGLPNLPKDVRNEMGYMQAGGMTEMQNDPLTREVTAFLLGESNNEEALNMFLTKYGNEAFMQLREAVLQSVVPGAQTEGLIRGDGQGGMDDDLRGMIGDKERIAVSQDEFIIPADVVSMLGDGSSDAGSKELYDMMDRVRKEKTGTTKQAPRLANVGGLLPA